MSDTVKEIDVRNIAPYKRHSTIFDAYDNLEEGKAFIIVNDHDPKPLGYQMAITHGEDAFSWEYLKKGPEVWKVQIGKSSNS